MSSDFRVTIDSLGNAALGFLGADAVEAVRVRWDEYLGTAQVGIVLRNDNWDTRIAVLERTDDLRGMFLDELVLDFVFEDRGEDVDAGASGTPSENRIAVFA